MKRPASRYFMYSLGMIPALILFAYVYLTVFLPNVGPAPDIQIEITEERVEHGKYLANHVMLCMDCHAVRDFSLFAGPPEPGSLGGGGEVFSQEMGLPGYFVSKNLTPSALGDWTDGEIYRAITSGVSRDGSALFPLMPYNHYSQLAEEDIYAVIAYLRTVDPIEREIPPAQLDFPVNILINTMPVKANPQPKPSPEDVVNYGRYMTTAAACTDCHTRMEQGSFVGEPFAGGNEYPMPDGSVVRSANITPHETGIGSWSKEEFISRFKVYADSSYTPHHVMPGQFQTYMPWLMYAGMTEEDLSAIYEYLRTIEPVENEIEIFSSVQ
jgi:mono/diheme cytochrome c family protein